MNDLYQTPPPEPTPSPVKTLVFGILGLVFACSFFMALGGIFFSALCLSLSNEYFRITGQLTGKIKVARILSRVGLILGIVMVALFLLFILSQLITYFGITRL